MPVTGFMFRYPNIKRKRKKKKNLLTSRTLKNEMLGETRKATLNFSRLHNQNYALTYR